jgi:transposase
LFFQKKIAACDVQINSFLKTQINTDPDKRKLHTDDKIHKRINKNAIKGIDLNQAAYQYFNGVDLMKIEGLSHSTILTIMSEIGPDGFSNFESGKDFTSWLRLAPNNKKTGGKIISNKVPKGSNRLKIALRHAANSIGNLKDTHLSNFFKKIAYKKGKAAAVSATARKLGVILWNMITKRIPYNPPIQYLFLDQKRKQRLVQNIKRNIAKFEIKPEEVGFITT